MSDQSQPVNLAPVAAASLPAVRGPDTLSPLGSVASFGDAVKMAKYLAASELVPESFRNKPENVVIALELAHRVGASVMAVMQSLYIVHGKPGFSAAFLVATLNASGRFSPLRYVLEGEGATRSCYCTARDRESGETLTGPRMTFAIAKAEGWVDRKGSKWRTMPDLMLSYRAATLFVRLFAPEVSLGLRSSDELEDLSDAGAPGTATILATPDDYGVVSRSAAQAGGKAPPQSSIVVDDYGRTVDTSTGEVLDGGQDHVQAAQDGAGATGGDDGAKDRAQADAPRHERGESQRDRMQPGPSPQRSPEDEELANLEGTDPIGDLSPGMQRTLLRRCHEARVTWHQVQRGIGVPISKATMNDALGWIDANGQA